MATLSIHLVAVNPTDFSAKLNTVLFVTDGPTLLAFKE